MFALTLAAPTLAPPNNLTSPAPVQAPARQATVAGALLRANDRLAPLNRQDLFERTAVGARGRINSARDAASAGENFPGSIDRTLQSW